MRWHVAEMQEIFPSLPAFFIFYTFFCGVFVMTTDLVLAVYLFVDKRSFIRDPDAGTARWQRLPVLLLGNKCIVWHFENFREVTSSKNRLLILAGQGAVLIPGVVLVSPNKLSMRHHAVCDRCSVQPEYWNTWKPRRDRTFLLNTRTANTDGGHNATVPTIPLNKAAFAFYIGKKSLLWKPVLILQFSQIFCRGTMGRAVSVLTKRI